jgi:hypothetical protein
MDGLNGRRIGLAASPRLGLQLGVAIVHLFAKSSHKTGVGVRPLLCESCTPWWPRFVSLGRWRGFLRLESFPSTRTWRRGGVSSSRSAVVRPLRLPP